VVLSVGMTFAFMLICLAIISWMFKTGYKLKN
jgi:ABC-2 type transport system permease protein